MGDRLSRGYDRDRHRTQDHNGVLAQSDSAARGTKDGEPLKTILEYAEEKGLSTGVVSNSSVASATPAACYAHVNDRRKIGEIFAQVPKPRFGDGVDVIMGPGRQQIVEATRVLGLDLEPVLAARGYRLSDSLEGIPLEARRAIVLSDSQEFDLAAATRRALDILSRNPRGFFLMVESDLHANNVVRGFERTIAFDQIIRHTSERSGDETLILFTADHSYDVSVHDGNKGQPLLSAADKAMVTNGQDSIRMENIRRDDDHAAEEVLVAARGRGAERVRGILSNTDLFHIMLAAYGWQVSAPNGHTGPRPRETPAYR